MREDSSCVRGLRRSYDSRDSCRDPLLFGCEGACRFKLVVRGRQKTWSAVARLFANWAVSAECDPLAGLACAVRFCALDAVSIHGFHAFHGCSMAPFFQLPVLLLSGLLILDRLLDTAAFRVTSRRD
jgi:hypothetical protein